MLGRINILIPASETDEELAERRKNFDKYKKESEKKLREQKTRLQDTLEEVESLRRSLMQLRQERGRLEAEAKVCVYTHYKRA